MKCYSLQNLTFFYPDQEQPVLDQINISIIQGHFTVLCGPSGSGKSTLLRLLKPVLAPYGHKSGQIFFGDRPLSDLNAREQSTLIGFVQQNPDNQIVTDKVWHELAFGLESLSYNQETIRLRVAEMASFFGIESWFLQDIKLLSGGQKQLLNLASIMVMQPSVLILDEPTSHLDPIAAADFIGAVAKINRELGVTIIMTEHRLDEVLPFSDKVIVLEKGQLLCQGKPTEVGEKLKNTGSLTFLAMPTPMRVYAGVSSALPCPITVRQGQEWLNSFAAQQPLGKLSVNREASKNSSTKKPVIEFDNVWFRYHQNHYDVLQGLSLKIYPGEFLAILGGNGTGKTTSLNMIAGILTPNRGKVSVEGANVPERGDGQRQISLGVLPQNSQALFLHKTLREDLLEVLADLLISAEEKLQLVHQTAILCRLDSVLYRHPYDLSGGEQQMAALAKVLLLKPRILLLDEPTKGLDAEARIILAGITKRLLIDGVTIVIVSHDVEFCAKYAQRCALFFNGSIVSEDTPRRFFAGNSFYTTAANRMARHLLPDALSDEDIINACNGDASFLHVPEPLPVCSHSLPASSIYYIQNNSGNQGLSKKMPINNIMKLKPEAVSRSLHKPSLLAVIFALLTIPLTAYFGVYYLGDRKYYFISMLIIIEAMIPFIVKFEGRRPAARELMVLAVLCALAVASRAAFFMLPQFKPVIAIIIISAVAFGAEAGFLVGALTAFVSNMFFGQGPWTPWQMLALGLIGLTAGLLFGKGYLRSSRLNLSLFGAFSAVIIYGGIMNPSAILTFQGNPTLHMFLLAFVQGLPFDLIQAGATFIFLWLISGPMLEKLDRVKTKYGLLNGTEHQER